MDGRDVLDALRHLSSSLHLDTPAGMMVAGLTISIAGLAVSLASKRRRAHAEATAAMPMLDKAHASTDEEQLLVMPDISGYGQFLSSVTSVEAARADETIITLLSALIQSVDGQLRVAKLEGDAVLFYAPTNKFAAEELGAIVLGLFEAFDQRKHQLELDLDLPGLARLDLKVAVHRGPARRLAYRNAIDLVGADVVLTYRLLKLDLETRRYVVATDRASRQIAWPLLLKTDELNQVVGEFGSTLLSVTTVPNSTDLRRVEPPTNTKKTQRRREVGKFGLKVPRTSEGKVAS